MKAFNTETGKADLDVSFPSMPEHTLWSNVCIDCDTVAGGCFSGGDLPEPTISKYAVCPGCGGKNLKLVQETGNDE